MTSIKIIQNKQSKQIYFLAHFIATSIYNCIFIVFLFLARVLFPKSKLVAEVILSKYNENSVKRIWKLEKLDYVKQS